jgi:hypothetical protein
VNQHSLLTGVAHTEWLSYTVAKPGFRASELFGRLLSAFHGPGRDAALSPANPSKGVRRFRRGFRYNDYRCTVKFSRSCIVMPLAASVASRL